MVIISGDMGLRNKVSLSVWKLMLFRAANVTDQKVGHPKSGHEPSRSPIEKLYISAKITCIDINQSWNSLHILFKVNC